MSKAVGSSVDKFLSEAQSLPVQNKLSSGGTRTRINALGRKWFIAEVEGVKVAILYYDAIYTDGREVYSPLLQKSVESEDLMGAFNSALADVENYLEEKYGFTVECSGITDAPPVSTAVTLLSEAANSDNAGKEDEEQEFTSREERESTVGYKEIQLELFA